MIVQREVLAKSDSTQQELPACRFCSMPLRNRVVDVGLSPLCESYLRGNQIKDQESFYPLHVRVCRGCFLVQHEACVSGEDIFTESSYSDTWAEHARQYAEHAQTRLRLDGRSFVVELASNDGYLLQLFVEQGIPVLGVEPARSVAAVAEERGVPTVTDFFGVASARQLSRRYHRADLIIANNVLPRVLDLNDFVGGIPLLLAWNGTVTMEFPHLARLIAANKFDTMSHEQYSYFSLYTVERIFAANGLRVYDVEELPTHSGSLRIWGGHTDDPRRETPRLKALRAQELAEGVNQLQYYADVCERVIGTKKHLI